MVLICDISFDEEDEAFHKSSAEKRAEEEVTSKATDGISEIFRDGHDIGVTGILDIDKPVVYLEEKLKTNVEVMSIQIKENDIGVTGILDIDKPVVYLEEKLKTNVEVMSIQIKENGASSTQNSKNRSRRSRVALEESS
ncbi:hypothetical protein NL676_023332 [Syzygium grande]|nr:hypothetical protein NL676_023332 [Syzygium grande]